MKVPEEIRKVKRPVNTIVADSGTDSEYRYAVRERKGMTYNADGGAMPTNGRVVGHIINGKFVPVRDKTMAQEQDILSYGAAALFHSVSQDLLEDLLEVYPEQEANSIMAIACVRATKPDLSEKRLETQYYRTFTRVYYPNCSLSEDAVRPLLQRIGEDRNRRLAFYQRRLKKVDADHDIFISSMPWQNNSTNELVDFTFQSESSEQSDASLLYACDVETMDPICAEAFPGSSIDVSAYKRFLRDRRIERGIIVSNQGFSIRSLDTELQDKPELHYLTPIRGDDIRVRNNEMLSFQGTLKELGKEILFCKRSIKGGNFLYAFKKVSASASDVHIAKEDPMDTVVLESDADMSPQTAYRCFAYRRLLEKASSRFRNDTDQSNVSLGNAFVNFIATTATCRMIRKAADTNVLNCCTYGDMLDDLNEAWREANALADPTTKDSKWFHTIKESFRIMEALGLCKPDYASSRRRRGRPKKEKTDTEV